MVRRPLVVLATMCTFASPLQAHEFWIEPEDYAVSPSDPVVATFRNGERFAGGTLSYLGGRSQRFDVVIGDSVSPVDARLGDNPALSLDAAPEGLLIVVHETADRSVTYDDWDAFARFADHKGFGDVRAAHDARGLPEAGFRESYRRYAKALIAVGNGAGADRPTGLFTEIVALANPYTDDVMAGLPVQVLLDGAPKAGAQVEVFEKRDGKVTVSILSADDEGRATVPVRPGAEYLLDSVSLEPLDAAVEGDPVWKTHWAALTFAVPGA